MDAAYVFRVRFRLHPEGVVADPNEFETRLSYPAPTPGESGWLFFQEMCWRGAVSDDSHAREWADARLDVDVTSVSFAELRTDEAYLEALRDAIAEHGAQFDGDSARDVLHRHLGSSVHVRDAE